MRFYNNQLFHIYNQGNNKQQVFFNDENYKFFLWKMRSYLTPFGDLIAFVLMPNHYHWLFFVRQKEVDRTIVNTHLDKVENQRRRIKYGKKFIPREGRGDSDIQKMDLNEAIGMVERTYTRAINKQRERTGSLFRKEAKAKDAWIDEFVTVKKNSGQLDFRFVLGTDYGFQCLKYIHKNPVEADLVSSETDWVFSSAKDYAGLRKGTICNLEMGRELMGFV